MKNNNTNPVVRACALLIEAGREGIIAANDLNEYVHQIRTALTDGATQERERLLHSLRLDADAVERHGVKGTAATIRKRVDALSALLGAAPREPERCGVCDAPVPAGLNPVETAKGTEYTCELCMAELGTPEPPAPEDSLPAETLRLLQRLIDVQGTTAVRDVVRDARDLLERWGTPEPPAPGEMRPLLHTALHNMYEAGWYRRDRDDARAESLHILKHATLREQQPRAPTGGTGETAPGETRPLPSEQEQDS